MSTYYQGNVRCRFHKSYLCSSKPNSRTREIWLVLHGYGEPG